MPNTDVTEILDAKMIVKDNKDICFCKLYTYMCNETISKTLWKIKCTKQWLTTVKLTVMKHRIEKQRTVKHSNEIYIVVKQRALKNTEHTKQSDKWNMQYAMQWNREYWKSIETHRTVKISNETHNYCNTWDSEIHKAMKYTGQWIYKPVKHTGQWNTYLE